MPISSHLPLTADRFFYILYCWQYYIITKSSQKESKSRGPSGTMKLKIKGRQFGYQHHLALLSEKACQISSETGQDQAVQGGKKVPVTKCLGARLTDPHRNLQSVVRKILKWTQTRSC
jgi:hypothetical protein